MTKLLRCFGFRYRIKCISLAMLAVTIPFVGTSFSQEELGSDEDIFELSPFEVSTTGEDNTYFATDTLAGSRIRTDLKDIASSISVVTSAFLSDTGSKNVQDLLVYTTNTEVGGIYGNYGGVGNTYINGIEESFLKPSNNTRVRGLDSADNTRDYFLSDAPWDAYNVSRVDLQRGPNSILFGIGSPAGIINSSLNTAELGSTFGSVENRMGSFNSVRFSADYNLIVLDDELAVRVALLDDHTKYRQKPAFNRDRRTYAALRWEPKLIESGHTTIRANFETGDIDANRPRMLPPEDRITPFFMSGNEAINKGTWDPYYAWQNGIVAYSSSDTTDGEYRIPWVGQYMGNASLTNNPVFVYDGATAGNASVVYQAAPATERGIGNDGNIDESINGFPYGSNIGILGYSDYAREAGLPAADKGFYKDLSLTDDSIFDFYNYLIDGPNKHEAQNWQTWNLSIVQTLWNDRIGIEAVIDHQQYDDSYYSLIGGEIPRISVDIRKNLMDYPWTSDQVVANPNAGRAYIAGNSQGCGGENFTERMNVRGTMFAEIRADDFMETSTLTDILGRHIFTGLYSKETYDTENRTFSLYALDVSYADRIGFGVAGDGTGIKLSDGVRTPDMLVYLSGDVRGRSSANGLNLSNLKSVLSPSGSVTFDVFNSNWNAPDVDPSAVWYNLARDEESTESENIANYVGWEPASFNLLNAFDGDRESLYEHASNTRKITESMGLTWQGYWWDENIVTTFGWRRDQQQLRSGSATDANSPTGVSSINPVLDPLDPETGETEGESISWGVVMHAPDFVSKKLPWDSNISLSYSAGKNTRVENRYGFDGKALPNSQGKTKDFSVSWTGFNDRIRVKATWYETEVADANIATVTGETTTLGSNTYHLYLLEAWGLASTLTDVAGRNGDNPGNEGYWNWAYVDTGFSEWDTYADPTSEAFLNHPSSIIQAEAIASFLSQLQPAEWWDAYGFEVDVEAAARGDYNTALNNGNWSPGSIGGVQAAGKGRINGSYPVGTVDNTSKGVEIEVSGQITDSWNLQVNVSKTDASQTDLGAELSDFIEAQYYKWQSPAGDLRLWWGGDRTFREYYDETIWAAYQFQLETNGKSVAELAPWKFSIISNYAFKEGALEGANLGIAYRWEDKHILGYALNEAQDNLDIDKPYWSDTYDHIDLWAGYERQLSNKIKWRIQLNLRNVGEEVGLVPLSAQPDGSAAQFRIQEGMIWSITNTISF